MTTDAEIKAEVRKAAHRARKAAFSAGQGAAADNLMQALAPFAGRALAGYLPVRTEIDPRPAMARWQGPVAVPVVVGEARPLLFRAWHPGAPTLSGAFGIAVPETGAEIVPEVLIVPLLAFDRRGFRLGYGGGFYDRTLEALRAKGPVTAIGFAFAAQEVPEVPVEPTDQPLDLIVTEAGSFAP